MLFDLTSRKQVHDSITIEMVCDADYCNQPEADRLRGLFQVRRAMLECNHEFLPSAAEHPDGCWYCGVEDNQLLFSMEWDTPVHDCCICKALHQNPKDQEAQVFAKEFDLDCR